MTHIIEREGEEQGLLNSGFQTVQRHRSSWKAKCKLKLVRGLALFCACSLSVGSHYALYILGPLKSRLSRELGTSNTEFGLLLAALSLSGTWTPLVGGVMTARLGMTVSSIVATGTVFLGQVLLLIGHLNNEVWLMILGMFVFGLGQSPLAVAQETIIVRFFKSYGLGISLALGLVAGKGASFVSARTSYPLSQWSPNAPFYVSTSAAGFSFAMNLVYTSISPWLIRETERDDAPTGAVEARTGSAQIIQHVADKKNFRMGEIFKLGDVVWAYIALNVLCGMIWHPFIHLSPNIFQHRFGLTELEASTSAAYLLSGSIFLYPLCGAIIDRVKQGSTITVRLMTLASLLTMFCFVWMVLPPSSTITPWPAIISFGTALGFAPLLLVVIVPRIVSLEYVSTTLGLHKSLEHTGGTITQTLAGLWLDSKVKEGKGKSDTLAPMTDPEPYLQWLLNGFLFVNVLHLIAIWGLGYLSYNAQKMPEVVESEDEASNVDETRSSPSSQRQSDSAPLLSHTPARDPSFFHRSYGTHSRRSRKRTKSPPETCPMGATTPAEVRRGKVFASLSAVTVVFAWVLFLMTSFIRIRSRREREGDT